MDIVEKKLLEEIDSKIKTQKNREGNYNETNKTKRIEKNEDGRCTELHEHWYR